MFLVLGFLVVFVNGITVNAENIQQIDLNEGLFKNNNYPTMRLDGIKRQDKKRKNIISPLARMIFNSTVETDRFQTYHWYNATPQNPNISPNGDYLVWEVNPLAVSTTRNQFDEKVDTAKILVNELPQYISNKAVAKGIYYLITVGEFYNVVENNISSKKTGYPRYMVFDFNYKF